MRGPFHLPDLSLLLLLLYRVHQKLRRYDRWRKETCGRVKKPQTSLLSHVCKITKVPSDDVVDLVERGGSEMDRISQQLTQRVKELAERYESALPEVTNRVAELESKVNSHLERMGFAWK